MPERWGHYTITAELLSDAHLGTGSGGAGIDALIARDRHGRPVIWASHLEGVLRDAARRLLGVATAGQFFGRPGGEKQRAIFTSLYADDIPESHVWRSAAREAFDNRAPKDDTLRVVEYVPRGTKFSGDVELSDGDLPTLRRLLHEVDALGGGRASGAGRVKLTLVEVNRKPTAVGEASRRMLLLLKNIEPLCITATATPDNLIPSLSFIPGRSVLGTIASWLIAEGYRDTATTLVDGRIVVSDALPIPSAPKDLSNAEVLPAPLSLQSEKPAGIPGAIPWWAKPCTGTKRLEAGGDDANGVKLKRPEDNLFVYRAAGNEPWETFRPSLRVRLRNGRPVPDQADASLFAIEQVAEGTLFLCELRGNQSDMTRLAEDLLPVLEGSRWLRVGRAGAPVVVAQLRWLNDILPGPPRPAAMLTLTSDLLVRDELLRWCTTLDQACVGQLPGWPIDVAVEPIVQDTVMVHGFNGTSRLWRMPAAALRRGSVFRVSGSGVAELANMAANGQWLGERTHEGFGRFRLDAALPGITSNAAEVGPIASSADAAEDAVARTTRAWLDAHHNLAEPRGASERKPSLSQWFDLVADLDHGLSEALGLRLNPTTAGAQCWKNTDANEILKKLGALSKATRASHARLFIRWLRAELRKEVV